MQQNIYIIIEPPHNKMHKMACASSEDQSDQIFRYTLNG